MSVLMHVTNLFNFQFEDSSFTLDDCSTAVKLSLVTDCPISSVTVYKDRAEICRTVEAVLKQGVNKVNISGFFNVDEDSIR